MMMQMYLFKRAAQNEWGDDRSGELGQNDRGLHPTTTVEAGEKAPQREINEES